MIAHSHRPRHRSADKCSSGLTLIEILSVVAIILILAVISLVTFNQFFQAEALQRDASAVASLLETARTHTLSAKNNAPYGVYFSTTAAEMFRGASHAAGTVITTEKLHPQVRFDAVSLSGGNEVVFDKVTGATDNPGSVTLESARQSASSTITIEPTGIITTEL